MQTLPLADSGRVTTRLGYGCSSLMGAMGERESLALLEAAYAAGIRHFDVAPMYGFGAAEACVGTFWRRHKDDVTVTTKYGIPAAKNQALLGVARRVAGPVLKMLPGMKQRLAKASAAVAGPTAKAAFTADEARVSLERSLRALQAECVDVWLLHEVEAESVQDEGLLRFLEDAKASGKIGSFGVGSDAWKVEALLREAPAYCGVIQHEWTAGDVVGAADGAFRIYHRALTEHFRGLHAALVADAERCSLWSEATGVDLRERETLANVMLKTALVCQPESVILVSSKNAGHIVKNAAVCADEGLVEPARRLQALMENEGQPRTWEKGGNG